MMTCQEAIEKLHAYLDRELTDAERAEVERHLHVCTSCTDAFHFESGILRFVGDRCRNTRASAALHQRVRITVRETTFREMG